MTRRTVMQLGAALCSVAVLIAAQALTPREQTFVVNELPTPPADADVAQGTDPTDDGEFFSAPGDDGEFFAAPGQDEVTPAVSEKAATSDDNHTTSSESSATEPGTANPSVAASLLLISPRSAPQFLRFFSHMLSDEPAKDSPVADEGTQTGAADADKATSDNEAEAAAKAAAAAEKAEEEKKYIIAVGDPNGRQISLKVTQWPMIGKPDADYIFVEMFDYTCPHCRQTNRAVQGAMKELGDRVAIVTLPVPLNRACNPHASGNNASTCEISKLAMAVWLISPEKFSAFHHWLMESERTSTSAREQAISLVGRENLEAELARPTAGEYIKRHTQLYQKVGGGEVPKLLFSRQTVVGEVGSTSSMVSMITRYASR